ncbi:MAG: hypothetical protein LBV03_01775, partial [Fusobacteriales bacterium]|nr:hypothetical protein [Fusobacteriales bacterium]
MFIVAILILFRFIIAGIVISVINLYPNLEILVREDIYIFFPSKIYLLTVSLIVLLVSLFKIFCLEKKH